MDEMLKERAARLFPDKGTYNLKEAAQILGLSPQTLYNNRSRYPLGKRSTLSQIEATTSRAANTRCRQNRTREDS